MEKLSLKEQIEKAEFLSKHMQPEINQICNIIFTILKRCPHEDRERARTLLTCDLNWWINEADVDYDPSESKKILEDIYETGELYEIL
jgi:DNA phosphorothioation-dependent restriction protein DptG